MASPSSKQPRNEAGNPYAPPQLNSLEPQAVVAFKTKLGWTFWLMGAGLILVCGALTVFLPVAGLLGVVLVAFAAARVPRMLKRGPEKLLIHNSMYLFGSSLVVVSLVALAAGISYSAMETTVAFLEPDRQSQFFPVILGALAFLGTYLYLYRVSVYLPF